MRVNLVLVLMNILRLVAAEKEKKNHPPNEKFQKLEAQAACKDHGQCPVVIPKSELRSRLQPVQYHVTQEKGTERPFSGKYLRLKDEGVYSCVVCDNALFTSDHKYNSGCGWPSFSDVIAQGKVTLKTDTGHAMKRVEITCSQCGSHLGHLFDDGPKPTQVRYCVNSASLDFKKHTTL